MRTPDKINVPISIWRYIGCYLRYLMNYVEGDDIPEWDDYEEPKANNAARDFYTCIAVNNSAYWVFRGNNVDDLLVVDCTSHPVKITQWKDDSEQYILVPNWYNIINM